MSEYIYYNPHAVIHQDSMGLPGMKGFSHFFRIYNMRMMLHDRTETIVSPVRIKTQFPVPAVRESKETLEAICDRRAREILALAEEHGVRIFVFWSGGVDSTLALVSLIKNATEAQKESLVVLLSNDSIVENPSFYEHHIRGKLEVRPSASFPSILGKEGIITNGELGDQVFGSPFSFQILIQQYGWDIIHKPYHSDVLYKFYDSKINDKKTTLRYLELFENLISNAPVKITSYFDYFWWLLFTLEWQSCYFRVLQFSPDENRKLVDNSYLERSLMPFFGTEDFQIWSMNNMDKRIKDTWGSYKWPAKEIIYAYTGDQEYYENKRKEASSSIWKQRTDPFHFIDSSGTLHRNLNVEEYYNPQNSFI